MKLASFHTWKCWLSEMMQCKAALQRRLATSPACLLCKLAEALQASAAGQIAQELMQLSCLTQLFFWENLTTGAAPAPVGGLSNLEEPRADASLLAGVTLSELFMLMSLDCFHAHDNSLDGPFFCPDLIDECLAGRLQWR